MSMWMTTSLKKQQSNRNHQSALSRMRMTASSLYIASNQDKKRSRAERAREAVDEKLG